MSDKTINQLYDLKNEYLLENINFDKFLGLWFNVTLPDLKCQSTFNKYYRTYLHSFSQITKNYLNIRMGFAVSLIKEKKIKNILEIGTGCGSEAIFFALKCGIKVTSIDVSEKFQKIALVRKNYLESIIESNLNIEFLISDINEFKPKEKFDLIWMHETFHHLEPRENVVRVISNLLKTDGYVLIDENNALNPYIQLSLFWRRGFQFYQKCYDEYGNIWINGNERILSASKLSKIFKRCDIEQISIKYYRLYPNFRFLNSLQRSLLSFEKIIVKLPFLKFLLVHYFYLGKKIRSI